MTATTMANAVLCQETKSVAKHPVAHSIGAAKMNISSPAVMEGQTVPRQHTVDGSDISPPLSWSAPPAQAASLAIVVDDPDAPGGVWYHWIMFNMKPTTHGLGANVPKVGKLGEGVLQGTNDFGKVGYNGPAPPRGALHHYRFKLLALDTKLALPAGVKKDDFLRAINGHVLEESQLSGTYKH